MRKCLRHLALQILAVLFSITAFSQSVAITGNVQNSASHEIVPAVSISVRGSSIGTFTDEKGNFRIVFNHPLPVTLVIISIGFETQEVVVTSAPQDVQVNLTPVSSLGTEVVVSASRVPERLLESPVSIERMGSQAIRNA